MIVRADHKYELRSRTTGRVLGTHPSYARALRQERAIKASQARVARHNPWVAEPTYVEWSDEESGWCVFGENSGYCYAVFPKRHQADRYAQSQPIRTGRVYEGAGAFANPSKRGFRELQDAWRKAGEAEESFKITLSLKYGDGWQPHWISKGELSKLNKLKEKTSTTSDRFIEWLDQNSPYDFQHGVNISWLRDRLTEEQALGADSPLLPAEAASYGYENKPFRPERRPMRNPSITSDWRDQLKDCGGRDPSNPVGWSQCDPRTIPKAALRHPEARRAKAGGYRSVATATSTETSIAKWIVPTLGIGAVAALFWWMSRPPQLLQASQIALQQRPFPDLSTLTDAQRTQIVRVAQTQLKQLGYPVTSIDGVSGPETQAAMTSFISANANAITNSASRYGQGEQAIILTLDDVYRRQFGLSAAA